MMSSDSGENGLVELHKVEGALDVLFELRELFAQWTDEAQDESKHEALENILGHVEAVELEYKHRRDKLHSALKQATPPAL